MKTFDLADVQTIEGDESASELDTALALQRAINGGLWSLQGSYGRAMMDSIAAGDCALGPRSAIDYWGNRIPARTEVEAGTKGSLDFVEARHDADWRKAIEEA